MYMFFWFFKQFYYCLRRIFKNSLLILFLAFIIFIFWFINKGAFAFSIDNTDYPEFPTEYQGKNFYIFTLTGSNNGFSAGTYAFVLNGSIYNFGTEEEPKLMQVSSANYIHGWLTSARYETARFDVLSLGNNQWNLNRSAWGGGIGNFNTFHYIGSTMDIYNYAWTQKLYEKNYSLFTEPIITNTTQEIEDWSFDTLNINCGSVDPESTFFLHCDYEGYTFTIDINQYKSITNNIAIISIPKTVLNESIVLRSGFHFAFGIQARTTSLQNLYYDLDSYTMQLTQEQEEIINEDSNKQVLSDINNNQQQTNEKLDNIENTMTDTTLTDDSVFFPSLDIPDLTRDGLTHIFDAFVLAFCTKTPNDIVVPIPYTNRSFTIPYTYTRDMLSQYGSQVLLNFIQIFWWYEVAKIIALDVYDKMDKLQSGDIENVQKSNITTKML